MGGDDRQVKAGKVCYVATPRVNDGRSDGAFVKLPRRDLQGRQWACSVELLREALAFLRGESSRYSGLPSSWSSSLIE